MSSVREAQSLKADWPMRVTPAPKLMVAMEVQAAKTRSPTSFTVAGRVAAGRAVQLLNMELGRVGVAPKLIWRSEVQ